MKKLGTKSLNTERLLLRRFSIEDAEEVFNNYANDEEVTKYLSWKPHKNIEATKEFLSEIIESYDDLSTYQWAIILKETGELIGSISVVDLQANRNQVEIGYVLAKRYWNKGIMSEALKEVISFFIDDVKVNKIILKTDLRNIASQNVALHAGMQFEKNTLQDGYNNSGVCDLAHFVFAKPHSKKVEK